MILLAQIQGQHTNALECAARGGAQCSASCAGRSDRSDRFAGVNQRVRRTLAREGPHQGKRTQGCSRVGRPPRTPSDVVEMQEE